MSSISHVLFFFGAVTLAGCGSSSFSGSAGKAGSDPALGTQQAGEPSVGPNASGEAGQGEAASGGQSGANQTGTGAGSAATGASSAQAAKPALVDAGTVLPQLGQDAQAVGNCLANLGISQLPPDAAEEFQELSSDSFSPFANSSVTDPDLTADPGKVYIRLVHMSGFGPVVNFDMNLLNPQGIYCIETDSFSVFTNSKITMCKTGKVASTIANHTALFDSGNILKVGCGDT